MKLTTYTAQISLLLGTLAAGQDVVQVVGTSARQTLDGFGCSLAFMGAAVQNLPASTRTTIFQTLFSATSGAGFSILRTRISPYLSSTPGTYDYTSDPEEVGTRFVIDQAKSFGLTRFLASAWTPPKYSKTNQDVNGGSIDTSSTSLSNYAAYLSKYVTTYKQTYNISWYAISPQNEPEVYADYESCHWEPQDFVNFIGTYLTSRLQKDGANTLVMAAESNEWQEGTVGPSLLNATSRSGIQIVAAHPYFAGEIQNGAIRTSGYDAFPLSKKYTKALWATEYCNGSSPSDAMVESIRTATLIHKHMTVPETTAFFYWWGASNKPDTEAAETLIPFNASGTYIIRKRLWAIGQFARFIRPGWVRLDATAEPTGGVHASAYRDAASVQTVIVLVNENTVNKNIKVNLYGFKASSVTAYRTSSSENLKNVGSIPVSQGSFTVILPPQSITTYTGATNSSATAFAGTPAFITEFNSLVGTSAASGDLVNKFNIGTIDPSNSGSDETALFRQTNTAEYIQYPITNTTFKSFVLSIQRNAYTDGLSFAAVSSSGALTSIAATKSAEIQQPGLWFVYNYTITTIPSGTQHIRISFSSSTNAEWNPRLTRLVITY